MHKEKLNRDLNNCKETTVDTEIWVGCLFHLRGDVPVRQLTAVGDADVPERVILTHSIIVLVGPAGLEPATSGPPALRATNCATARKHRRVYQTPDTSDRLYSEEELSQTHNGLAQPVTEPSRLQSEQ